MVRAVIQWSLNNPLVVILLAFGWAAVGIFSFTNVNVEAYPDPAPAIVEVVAQQFLNDTVAVTVKRRRRIVDERFYMSLQAAKYDDVDDPDTSQHGAADCGPYEFRGL